MVRSIGSRIERDDRRQSLDFFGLLSLHRTSTFTTLNICSQPQSRRGRLSRFFFFFECCVLCHAPSHVHSDWFTVRWLGSVDVLLSWDPISPYSGAHAKWITLHSPGRNPPAQRRQVALHSTLGHRGASSLASFYPNRTKTKLRLRSLGVFFWDVLCIFSRQLWWLLSTLLRGVSVGSMWFSFESVLTLSLYTLIV